MEWAISNTHCILGWALRNVPIVVYGQYTVTEVHVWNHSKRGRYAFLHRVSREPALKHHIIIVFQLILERENQVHFIKMAANGVRPLFFNVQE